MKPIDPLDAWMQTRNGGAYYFLAPDQSDMAIEDIARALSMQCRFNGHTEFFYSVAQHSVYVSQLLEEWGASREVVLCGLMHDASEAFLGDMVSPLKEMLPTYRFLEWQCHLAIAERFRLLKPWPEVVKDADLAMLDAERDALLKVAPHPWPRASMIEVPWDICEMTWQQAENLFLSRFRQLNPNFSQEDVF